MSTTLPPAPLPPPSASAPLRAGADRPAAKTDEAGGGEALEAARAFEKLLIHDMLKTMRRSAAILGEEPSDGRAMYEDMLDERLAAIMSEAGGLGLAKALAGQLEPADRHAAPGGAEHAPRGAGAAPLAPGTSGTSGDGAATVRGLATADVLRLRALRRPAGDAGAGAVPPGADVLASGGIRAYAASGAAPADDGPSGAVRRAERRAFIEPLLPHARVSARRLGTAPEAVLAIAALESGWGRHVATGTDGTDSHNLFGIKARPGEPGAVSQRTTEYLDGERTSVVAEFRVFDDRTAAVQGFADFVLENPRYAPALAHAADPPEFLRRLHAAGYATDPRYADKAIRVMQHVLALQESPS